MHFNSHLQELYQSQVTLHSAIVDNHATELGPREAAAAERMVDKRLREFSTGRFCAHKALAALHPQYAAIEIPIGENREPLWPDGCIGSITHDRKLALAVVSQDPQCLSLGIDLQPFECLNKRVSERIASEPEITAMRHLIEKLASDGELKLSATNAGGPENEQQNVAQDSVENLQGLAACLLFSIKESIFKCYFPVHRIWIDFKEARVEDPALQVLADVSSGAASPLDAGDFVARGSYRFAFKTAVLERMRDKGVSVGEDIQLPEVADSSDGAVLTESIFHGRFLITADYVVSTAELVRSASV